LEEIGKLAKEDPQYQEAKEAALEEPAPKEIRIQDNLLYRKEKLWIPAAAVQQAMESEHDTRVAGHMGQDKTIVLKKGFSCLVLSVTLSLCRAEGRRERAGYTTQWG